MRNGLLLCLILLSFFASNAQQNYAVKIYCNNCNPDLFDFEPGTKYDSLQITAEIERGVNKLQLDNYLLANLDSIKFEESNCYVYFFKGIKYKVDKISFNENDALIINALGINRINLNEQKIDSTLFREVMQQTIQYLVNNGYPFASVGFDKPEIIGQKLSAKLSINKNQYISFDTLDFVNEAPVSKNYLSQYLNLKVGSPYDHRKILSLENRIKETGFLKLKKSPWVSFINEKAIVRLPIEAKASNSFDFLIGVLPTNEDRKSVV